MGGEGCAVRGESSVGPAGGVKKEMYRRGGAKKNIPRISQVPGIPTANLRSGRAVGFGGAQPKVGRLRRPK